MDPQYKKRFNDEILAEGLRRYGIAPGQVEVLDGFESFIYAFERENAGAQLDKTQREEARGEEADGEEARKEKGVLRIGHAERRSENLIHGEVDWINYLAAHGTGVARAIPSARGKLVEALPDGQGGAFLATAFAWANGHSPTRDEMNSPALWVNYGRLLGRMHALARLYQPANPAWRRIEWDHPLMDLVSYLPAGEERAAERYHEVMAHLKTLPRDDPAAYGLIHQDAHGGNFFVDDEGKIILFDFDDCCYGWYAQDIAIVLFYISVWKPDRVAFAREFMEHFMSGYREENDLDPAWLAEIPYFLKQREIDLYAAIHRSYDVNNLDPADRFVVGYMRGRKERIEAGIPFLE